MGGTKSGEHKTDFLKIRLSPSLRQIYKKVQSGDRYWKRRPETEFLGYLIDLGAEAFERGYLVTGTREPAYRPDDRRAPMESTGT